MTALSRPTPGRGSAAILGGRGRWLAVGLALLIGVVNVGLGVVTGTTTFALVGASYGLWVALYFSSLWRPVLHVLVAIHAGGLGVLWALDGMPYRTVGLVVGVLSVAFVLTVLSLFVTGADRPERDV